MRDAYTGCGPWPLPAGAWQTTDEARVLVLECRPSAVRALRVGAASRAWIVACGRPGAGEARIAPVQEWSSGLNDWLALALGGPRRLLLVATHESRSRDERSHGGTKEGRKRIIGPSSCGREKY